MNFGQEVAHQRIPDFKKLIKSAEEIAGKPKGIFQTVAGKKEEIATLLSGLEIRLEEDLRNENGIICPSGIRENLRFKIITSIEIPLCRRYVIGILEGNSKDDWGVGIRVEGGSLSILDQNIQERMIY